MTTRLTRNILATLLIAFLSSAAVAGSTADAEMKFTAEEIAEFSKLVEQTVADRGARVFLVARVGRAEDKLPKGVHYTHVGFGVYSMIEMDDGSKAPGYTMYNLYQKSDAPDKSELVQDYPFNFFAGVQTLKAGIIIPTPELQRRLLRTIASDTYSKTHNPKYSVLANPFNSSYQNCTEHTLDVINAAIYETDDVKRIKAHNAAYFKPYQVPINRFVLMMGSLVSSEVRLGDHNGPIQTATFTTISDYLSENGLIAEQLTLTN